MSLVKLLEETPEDVSIMGDLMDISDEEASFSQEFDTFYDPRKKMMYLGDTERIIGVRKRGIGGEGVVVTRDIAPVDDYEEILEREGFPAVVGYAESGELVGYDPDNNGFHKSPEEQMPKTTLNNRSNTGDKTVSRALNQSI